MLTTSSLPFEYEIVRAKRKTVAIHVENGTVQVRAPLRVSKQWISEFVCAQTQWVLKRLEKEAQTPPRRIELRDGAIIHYLGSPITLCLRIGTRTTAHLSDNQLMLTVKSFDNDHIKKLFVGWLKTQAADYIVPRCHALANKLALNHKITAFRFRVTRASWGCCSSKGVIQFNPLILLMEPAAIDYLIAHEICHLRHMNHSPSYWALVESVCPNYRHYKRLLRSTNDFHIN
jgi:hypothetical protein